MLPWSEWFTGVTWNWKFYISQLKQGWFVKPTNGCRGLCFELFKWVNDWSGARNYDHRFEGCNFRRPSPQGHRTSLHKLPKMNIHYIFNISYFLAVLTMFEMGLRFWKPSLPKLWMDNKWRFIWAQIILHGGSSKYFSSNLCLYMGEATEWFSWSKIIIVFWHRTKTGKINNETLLVRT